LKQIIRPGGKYFYTRNSSTLVAFAVGEKFEPGCPFKIVGAHTDSPALKVKPVSKRDAKGYVQVGVETYGGGLWHTWLDRDLGIAGRVVVKEKDDKFVHRLVHINKPLLRVPSLCIHLQSADERAALKINAEEHLTAVLGLTAEQLNKSLPGSIESAKPVEVKVDTRHPTELIVALARELGVDPTSIVDLDLTLADTQKAQIGGANNEFLFAPRLDNQMHCFTSTEAIVAYASSDRLSSDNAVSMICLFDHEEVGSESVGGAGSPVMRDAVERICEALQATPGTELYKIALDKSILISADGAHAIHPNYQGKHEVNHQPKMNAGTVIKTNQNQRYATSGVTGFIIREIARKAKVPVQEFVVRQDSPCGSTIGPIIAANTGIRTVDVGIPQLSMHSIRETCGVYDLQSNSMLLHEFFNSGVIVDQSLVAADRVEGEIAGGDFVKV
jgi:aspartyl aminopeptidase